MQLKKSFRILGLLALNSISCATAVAQRPTGGELDVEWSECVKSIPAGPESPIKAYPRTEDFSWMSRNEWCGRVKEILNDPARSDARLAFMGDSITQMWPKAELSTHFAPFKPIKLGIGGDKTQTLLWRMDNGELKGLSLKDLVLLIGTNNLGADDSPESVKQGIKLVIDQIRQDQPNVRIMLMAIFPRGELPSDPLREKIAATNRMLAASAKDWKVRLLDIGPRLVEKDGTIRKEIMGDFVHLTPQGYEIWRQAVLDALSSPELNH